MTGRNGEAKAEEVSSMESFDSRSGSAASKQEPMIDERIQGVEQEELSGSDAEIQKLKAERDNLVDRLARLQAEFENARKRSVREQQDFRDFALADAIKNLLPVADSFERALQLSAGEQSEIRSGIELIYKQFQDALSRLGLVPITAEGGNFDPHLHEAIEMVDTDDAPDQQVIEELQRGYKLKERLLRPAMVKVARSSRS